MSNTTCGHIDTLASLYAQSELEFKCGCHCSHGWRSRDRRSKLLRFTTTVHANIATLWFRVCRVRLRRYPRVLGNHVNVVGGAW